VDEHSASRHPTEKSPPQGKLHRLFEENFLLYTSYVIRERAIPDIDDGLKPVQRRILQTLHNMDDGRFHKVANVVGETMKLHPHGDASIFSALVNLANKEYLIERQGNFGNIYTGDQASAPRYIECRLTELARETLFNKDLTTFIPSYDGRLEEPLVLPAKLPLLLLLGAEGIAVGMATRIMPHNFRELLEAQIACLEGRPFTLYPDFPRGGIVDVSEYDSGNGVLRCRARIEVRDEKTIVIRELPYNLTTQDLIESIEKAAKAGKVKIQSISDYTAEEVEVEIKLARGIYAEETIDALYAFTSCEIKVSPSLIVIRDNMPVQLGVEDVLRHNTRRLVEYLTRELTIERDRLLEKLQARKLEQIFIEERLYKQIEELTTYRAIVAQVRQGLEPFQKELVRPVRKEDVERLLEIRIRRISRYDIERQRKEIRAIEREIRRVERELENPVRYAIGYLRSLLERYGDRYPRRTRLERFEAVTRERAALADRVAAYHRASGFLGTKVQEADADLCVRCSEYDRIMLVFKDGRYQVISVPEKRFVGDDLLWMGVVEQGLLFNVVYRHGPEQRSYVKRFRMPKYIVNREYRLFPPHRRSRIQLLRLGDGVRVRVHLAPSARARTNVLELCLDDFLVKGVQARGKRIAARPVRRVYDITGRENEPREAALPPLPGPYGVTAVSPRTTETLCMGSSSTSAATCARMV